MPQLPSEKLLLRLGIAMSTITAFAFLGMLSSVFIAEAMEGAAAAINQAGTLRMQSYRIASTLGHGQESGEAKTLRLIEEFDTRLRSERLVSVVSKDPTHEERSSYNDLVAEWSRQIKPVLKAYTVVLRPRSEEGRHPVTVANSVEAREALRQRFLSTVDAFVQDIDRFVNLLERKTEAKVRLLRIIHLTSLFFTLTIVAGTMYMMHTQILMPLRDLLTSAERVRRGDFSTRVSHTSNDELGQLGAAFNLMAEDLSKIYADLEERVRIKTADLERSNKSLELLYSAATRLNQAPLAGETYQTLLQELDNTLGLAPSTICLSTPDESRFFRLATTRGIATAGPDICVLSDCQSCTNREQGRRFTVNDPYTGAHLIHSFPIRDQEKQYGVLLVTLPHGRELQGWQQRLLVAVATQIGTAITVARRTEQGRRVALLEERNVIARELHDSLAQSLSYMKIQASRLENALEKGDKPALTKKVLGELRGGVSSAYRQLRELLSTFRLQMDGRGLATALAETVSEFELRGGTPIQLDYAMEGCQLSPNEEIHVLQVAREAISNATRHAHASEIQVNVRFDPVRRTVRMQVDDDGIGIPPQPERTHHYGLAIMDERARSLDGEVQTFNRECGGTRVELVFTPASEAARSQPGPRKQSHV